MSPFVRCYDTILHTKYTRLIEIKKCIGMEMNVAKAKIKRSSVQAAAVQMLGRTRLEYLKLFSSSVSLTDSGT
jgi:hypothetical protein